MRIRFRSKKLADTAEKISRFEKGTKKREQDELKRLLSILGTIDKRLGEKYEIDRKDHRELLDFDPNYLFDAIDEDKNNILTYAELDKAMVLTGEKLLAFIKLMNEADDLEGSSTGKDQNHVSRETFVKHFLPVIKRVAYFDPSPSEIDDLFDEISKAGDNISVYDLKYSSLAMFLGDHDIRKLEVFFRNKLAGKKYGTHSIDNMRRSITTSSLSGDSSLSKTEFRDWLPKALKDLVRGDELEQEPLDIYFKDLLLDIKGSDGIKTIINGITGQIEVGKMTAVMGKYFDDSSFSNSFFFTISDIFLKVAVEQERHLF